MATRSATVLRKGLKAEAAKLAFLIAFPVAVTIVLTNPNIIPKLVHYYNYVQYPAQVDITKEQVERNIEYHEIFTRKFEDEVKKMKAQQAQQELELQSNGGGSSSNNDNSNNSNNNSSIIKSNS